MIRAAAVLILCFLVLGAADVARLQLVPPSSQPANEQSETSAQQTSAQSQPYEPFWQRVTHDPVAFFTFWVALFTFVLAVSTTGLWVMGIVTARRQLRAYITIKCTNVEFVRDRIHVTMTGRNNGQTPAKNVRSWYVIALEPPPFDEDWLNDPATPDSASDVGGGDTFEATHTAPDKPSPGLADVIRSGKLGCWMYGTIWYDDVFNRRHTTKFRLVMKKRRDGQLWLVPDDKGNELK
ncbi:MAG: hypothetical protein BroJett030_15280 [Alphaproteobacteria bacterium]|nr:MAG: hypothetical protein BroJett030_15280 [Alphaproteobacteria bacterium]